MILETLPELQKLTVDQKIRLSLELAEDVAKATEGNPALRRALNDQLAAASDEYEQDEALQLYRESSREFREAVEKSIGAPLITKRLKVGK